MVARPLSPGFRLEPLAANHAVGNFACGNAEIDAYLRVSAIAEQTMGLSSVTVAIDPKRGDAIVGFFTQSPLSIRIDPRVLTALGIVSVPYPSVGGYLLGRLGVDRRYTGQGVDGVLVAVGHARRGREGAGGVFLAVDAKDDDLVRWYQGFGFARLDSRRHRCVMRL